MKNVEVKFPLIEDITMEIAKMSSMLQAGAIFRNSCAW